MTPELALQKAVRTRLIGTSAVTDLVPAGSILDRNQRPAPFPSIVIGEGQSVDEGNSIARTLIRVYLDLHIWKKEPSTEGVKAIAGAIRAAIKTPNFGVLEGFHFADCYVQSARFLRDPDGETSHAVVTINALVQEIT
ncbi:DUF3168 domain-containing protein [Shinella curvata]|uniref:DUF3168 domain-containing protein n=1 Tax=Shinella curvata TaxID=1817964 RepID=A0ABT8XHL6_9HYPH|nr:DUF3168 domain-containing protein [Shinella curvata]MCJ8053891.1 DUF3168 domain-containing protein [Shinella curvata]MDO6123223.1 DUF3168 domain-containing protein [Shinella curvata]